MKYIKYLGNKKRLLPFINSVIDFSNRKDQTGVDLFSGTGIVSREMSENYINVISNDIMFYSFILNSSNLNNHYYDEIEYNINIIKNKLLCGFIFNHYSENVGVNIFKNNIAMSIDGNRFELELLKNNMSKSTYYFILNSIIIESDFRSNIMGTYASFYKAGWRNQALIPWDLRIYKNKELKTKNLIFNMDANNCVDFLIDKKIDVDFFYMDPPYNGRQYGDNFHVLETIAKYDNPITSGKVNKRKITTKSKFCYKSKCLNEFDNVVYKISNLSKEIFISYNNEGIMSIRDIINILNKYYKYISLFESKYRRFKTNSLKKTNKNVVEMLIKGENK